jgi:hypothetical protein
MADKRFGASRHAKGPVCGREEESGRGARDMEHRRYPKTIIRGLRGFRD